VLSSVLLLAAHIASGRIDLAEELVRRLELVQVVRAADAAINGVAFAVRFAAVGATKSLHQ